MIITEICLTKKGRYSIYVDGEFFSALHEDVFYGEGVSLNQEITQSKLLELKALSEEKITRDRAFKLLSARSYTAKRLMEKLREYGEEDICIATVTRMEELGLINDYEYAMSFARDLYNLRNFSKRRIIQELMAKGIDKETALEATEQFDWQEDKPRIEQLLLQKYKQGLKDPKEKNRAVNYLLRYGFSYDDIKSAINAYNDEYDWD